MESYHREKLAEHGIDIDFVQDNHSPQHDRGILWSDPAIGIDWPTANPILSEKDKKHPLLNDAEINF